MKHVWGTVATAVALAISHSAVSQVLPNYQASNPWYQQSQQTLNNKLAPETRTKAKNVILFVGDGMGVSTLTAARILEGQQQGLQGEDNALSFEKFDHTALVKTYNVDAQTPDSAGTMTAMITGVKTDVGVISIDEDISRGDCSTVAGNELTTALELAELKGLATGVISTARITHATPAATYAKSADRNWEDISDMPEAAVNGGCQDIADQLINFETLLEARFDGADVDGIDVVMGGGRRHFLPKDEAYNTDDAVSAIEGDRTDGRDLTAEWQAKYPQGNYVYNQAGFDAIDATTATQVLGLFNESHMRYEADRTNDLGGEPSLSEMTAKAIDILDNNDNGYLLVVESGRIDHGHHAGSAYNALTDTIEFSNAVELARQHASDDTLILVTADHSHVFTLAGYPRRGNPILGKVVDTSGNLSTDANGLPYTTAGYTNGLGFRDLGDETDADAGYGEAAANGRIDISAIDTTASGYHQEALIPLSSETHAGEDISLHANGPGAQFAQGVMEQNQIFHLIDNALTLVAK
ncbi:alkaline phosphatase [Ferrimonas kyonanensis]|uniref:alkaline phosphatase n=1 Tax=Ferrimonas kyonanensis TaxID=364763 RepID=UPI000418E430|nr:alkaline phosphatase [Ferrimonas kyonanensis]